MAKHKLATDKRGRVPNFDSDFAECGCKTHRSKGISIDCTSVRWRWWSDDKRTHSSEHGNDKDHGTMEIQCEACGMTWTRRISRPANGFSLNGRHPEEVVRREALGMKQCGYGGILESGALMIDGGFTDE